MTNYETPRATAFIARAQDLGLDDEQILDVLSDLLDIAPIHQGMLALHEFGQDLVQSDDDYDDFQHEVRVELGTECDECYEDVDDCECDDDEDYEADPIDLQDEAEGRF